MNRRGIIVAATILCSFSGAASLAASAQDSPPLPAASPSQPTAPTQQPRKAKKIWTNEDLPDGAASTISQPGDPKNHAATRNAPAKPAKTAATFRKQLENLHAQLAVVEKQIADLKGFSKGETPGAIGLQMHKHYNADPIEDQLSKLEDKRKSLSAQIDALFDAARKQGIEPGQLR
jgi:hypothetical protein